MRIISNKFLLKMLLVSVYTTGVLGIVACGGGGGGGGGGGFFCQLAIEAVAPTTDGSGDIWIGVTSESPQGNVDSVVRLNSSGSEQVKFVIDRGNENEVRAIAIANDPLNANKVYVGGDFAGGILRLNEDGSLDASFVVGSGFDDRVSSIAPADDGTGDVYVTGRFSNYGNTIVSGFVRLDNGGELDTGFDSAGGDFESIALATDAPFLGYIYSGGRSGVERWDNLGIKDSSFNEFLEGTSSVTPAADASGAIYVGGPSSPPSEGVARLNSDGIIDGSFDTGTGFNYEVMSIVRADDGTGDIYAGGLFTTYDGASANGIARLLPGGSPAVNFSIGDGFGNRPNDPYPHKLRL